MRMNLGLIFTGLIFFFNPNFNMLDILPDFIGCILIMSGLSKMYMYDGNFEDAKRSAKFLLWISVIRFILCMWVNSGNRDYLLPFTFIACVLEAIYMISLFKGLYLGAEYTLMRADCENRIKGINEAFTMSFIFTLGVKALEFAPNICDLVKQDAELDLSAGASFKMSMAQMKVYVLGVCLICSLILGLIWLFVTAKIWIKLISDKQYAGFLKEKYESYLELDREVYMSDRIKKIYFLSTFAFAFFADFYIDGINIFPSVLGILLMFSASLYLCRHSGTKKSLSFAVAISASASSVLSYMFMSRVHFGINYLFVNESYNKEEFTLLSSKASIYYAAIFALLEFLLTFALILLVLFQMRTVFKNEKRSVALPMLRFAAVPSFLALLCAAANKVLTVIRSHIATDEYVLGYVQGKSYITNEEVYNAYMENPLIRQYESITDASLIFSALAFAFTIASLLYMLRINRFTEN